MSTVKDPPRPLRARLLADLGPILDGWSGPRAFGVGWDGAIYVAAGRTDESPMRHAAHGSFPKSTLDDAADYLVVRWSQGRLDTLVHRGESLVVSYVQPLLDGVLLVAARCHCRPEGAERNAVVLDWGGRELRRMTLGDGIQDLRTTRDGTIWASYFDEGVFGNYGWGDHPGLQPIGAPGLVAFTPTGDVHASFEADAAGTDSICDAYAMNVEDDGDVWVYFYTEFPLVRLHRGTYQTWRLQLRGARAVAVRENRALLFDDYEHSGLARIVELRDTGHGELIAERSIETPSGEPLAAATVIGAGARLFAFQDGRVYIVDGW